MWDVAQLGERLPCTQKVAGSIPVISTTFALKDQEVIMKSVFQLDKQGDIAPVGYQAGAPGPVEAPKPTFFDSLAAAEHHLAKVLSCDVQRVLDGPVGRIYKSHLGTFALIEHALVSHPDAQPASVEAPKAE
jgi:hypothetical protein